jgi:hypothetical protein
LVVACLTIFTGGLVFILMFRPRYVVDTVVRPQRDAAATAGPVH